MEDHPLALVQCEARTQGIGDARNANARAIRESETERARAWAAKDVDKVMSHYADDASVELADVPIMSGKDGIRAGVKKTFADPNFALSFAPDQIEVSRSGDLASRGSWTGVRSCVFRF